jgi:hypothetical protein
MKIIDPKFHIVTGSYAGRFEIVKTSNGEPIPDDEPLILFRARDRNALATLKYYRQVCKADGCNDFQMEGIENRIAAFEKFRDEQTQRMKQPGITRGL